MTNIFPYIPQFDHGDVEVLDRQQCYRGFVHVEKLQIRHRLFANQDFGGVIHRELVRRREAAGVLVHDPALKKFLLIEQFRAGALNATQSPWQLEIIAGLIDDGWCPECPVSSPRKLIREQRQRIHPISRTVCHHQLTSRAPTGDPSHY